MTEVGSRARGGFWKGILGIPEALEDREFSPTQDYDLVEIPPKSHKHLAGITAAATRLTTTVLKRDNPLAKGSTGETAPWQEEAWDMLDLVGEQRFLINTIAGRAAQAAIYIGRTDSDDSPGTRPEHVEDPLLTSYLNALGDGVAGLSQLIHRMAVNLNVAGECWLVGIPPRLVPGSGEFVDPESLATETIWRSLIDRETPEPELSNDDVLSLVWKLLSVTEISLTNEGEVEMLLPTGETVTADANDLWLIRIWRPHPRKAWQADSPTRASLPVLRELVALTMHISAQLDSRLAGAGLLLFSSEASREVKRQAGIPENDQADPFMEALTDAMMTPISDRSSASAVVPLIATVPDPDKAAKYISFATPLDNEARPLRDEAIRRLALGQDAPPELLLGTGGMNHWGAWLVREETVKTHLEPLLALICDALTTSYLRPILEVLGYSDEDARRFVIWFDTDHLIARPNKVQDAKDLYAAGVISETALRDASGFQNDDAPQHTETSIKEQALTIVIDAVKAAPSLAASPGIETLLEQVEAALSGVEIPTAPTPEAEELGEESTSNEDGGGLPETGDDSMEIPVEG